MHNVKPGLLIFLKHPLWRAEHNAEKFNHVIRHSNSIIKCCNIALQFLFQTSLTKGYFYFGAPAAPCQCACFPSPGFAWCLAGPQHPSCQRASAPGTSAVFGSFQIYQLLPVLFSFPVLWHLISHMLLLLSPAVSVSLSTQMSCHSLTS